MSNGITVSAIVEGTTEEYFFYKLFVPEFANKNIWIDVSQVS